MRGKIGYFLHISNFHLKVLKKDFRSLVQPIEHDALFEKEQRRRMIRECKAHGVQGSQIPIGSISNLIYGVRSFALSKYTIFVI